MAKLRGVKPAAIEKRLKLFMYGQPGVGKTWASIQFPNCYLIDTERGAENDQYVEQLEKSGGASFFTTDLEDLIEEVKTLMTTKHSFKTLVIDPLTVPYADMCTREAERLATAKDPSGSEFARNKQIPDRLVKHLFTLCNRLDMNVIMTSHAKAEWKDSKPTGNDTYDCFNKMEYLFDLSICLQKRGPERWGIVKKTRLTKFPDGDQFKFSYDEIADRYGRSVIEQESTPAVLATPEQVARIESLIELLSVKEEAYSKWLAKEESESWAEMPSEAIQKYIAACEARVKPTAAA